MARRVADRAGIAPFYVMEVMKAAGERARAGGDVLHLEVGQPSTPAPQKVVELASAAMRESPLHYTDATGTPELRLRISQWYVERYGVEVEPERVVVTAGASGACVLSFLACFGVGDRVAVAAPGYPCYRNILAALGIVPVEVEVGPENRFQLSPALLEEAAQQYGVLDGVVLASPSNPTGTMLGEDELAELARYCIDRDIRLISDEIYHGIHYGTAPATVLAHDGDAIVINSFSKYFSMTGWRLGWLVLPVDLVTPIERLAQNLTVAPPTLPQLAALAAFDSADELDAHVERYARNRDVLIEGLTAAGFDRLAPADGAFYLWVDVSDWTDDAEKLCRTWLDELGVATTPGIDFDPRRGHHFVRFSFSGATDTMIEAMRRLVDWAQDRRPG